MEVPTLNPTPLSVPMRPACTAGALGPPNLSLHVYNYDPPSSNVLLLYAQVQGFPALECCVVRAAGASARERRCSAGCCAVQQRHGCAVGKRQDGEYQAGSSSISCAPLTSMLRYRSAQRVLVSLCFLSLLLLNALGHARTRAHTHTHAHTHTRGPTGAASLRVVWRERSLGHVHFDVKL